MRKRSENEFFPFLRGLVGGVGHFGDVVGEAEAGERFAVQGDAFNEVFPTSQKTSFNVFIPVW